MGRFGEWFGEVWRALLRFPYEITRSLEFLIAAGCCPKGFEYSQEHALAHKIGLKQHIKKECFPKVWGGVAKDSILVATCFVVFLTGFNSLGFGLSLR